MTKTNIPTFEALMNPVLLALKNLGGSGTIEEIDNEASEIAGLSDEQLEILYNPEKGGKTEVEYRLARARTYLKNYGVIENSSRGVWALTTEGRKSDSVDPKKVTQFTRERARKTQTGSVKNEPDEIDSDKSLTVIRDISDKLSQIYPGARNFQIRF